MVKTAGFSKSQRLCSAVAQDRLFETGTHFHCFPFKVVFLLIPAEAAPLGPTVPNPSAPAQILISVPKKRFKHAVDRNRIKRLIRESYRPLAAALHETLHTCGCFLQVAFIYISHDIQDAEIFRKKMAQAVERLRKMARESAAGPHDLTH